MPRRGAISILVFILIIVGIVVLSIIWDRRMSRPAIPAGVQEGIILAA
jgi:hypothetical protein